ncbi:transposable element Tcb1 transposase [Trichonephila clavipes]|nr:transposable element Tcb1 transposase [Trichonephila clavipes]
MPVMIRYHDHWVTATLSGCCSLAIKVTVFWLTIHEFESCATVDPLYRGVRFTLNQSRLKVLPLAWEIGSRVGRNQTTVMRICDHWMQEGTTDRRGRSHSPQCTTSREERQIVRMAVKDRSVTSGSVAQHIECVVHH